MSKFIANAKIRNIEAKEGHFVADFEQAFDEAFAFHAELSHKSEPANEENQEKIAPVVLAKTEQVFSDFERDMMQKLTRRLSGTFTQDKLNLLRGQTRLHLVAKNPETQKVDFEFFVMITLGRDERGNKDSQVKKGGNHVMTRQGAKALNLLSEHKDDDIRFDVVAGKNLVDVDEDPRLKHIKRNPGKSETFHIYLTASGEFDLNDCELPAGWLKPRLEDFKKGKIKAQWTGSERAGYSLPKEK